MARRITPGEIVNPSFVPIYRRISKEGKPVGAVIKTSEGKATSVFSKES